MKFETARKITMRFGKYKGWPLDQIAETDEGLRYLDWLLGQEYIRPPLLWALEAYLTDPSIESELDRLQE